MSDIAKHILTDFSLFFFLFSTCVDEALLCKGIPLCENKNDLKACKMNMTSMNIDYGHWHSIKGRSTCTPIDHPEYVMPFGQAVDNDLIADNSQFYCLNRGDKNPFLIKNSGSNETEADSKTWSQWMNTSCPNNQDRRCLGLVPDRCVDSFRKYYF